MKVLVTGKDGFIGKHLASSLREINVCSVGRSDLDLTNRNQVDDLFNLHTFDAVIHTAISGGRRGVVDDSLVIQNNLLMFYNIMSNKHRFGKLIQLGSGAEFDRFDGHDIDERSQLTSSYPIDSYGISKNIISKLCNTEQNCYTLRIYNVFGFGELPSRMMYNNINRYINKQDIVIIKNRFMDFFSIEDFVSVCTAYITNNNLPKDINCCYSNKTTLLDIANRINNLDSHKVKINILNDGVDTSYCGDATSISHLPIALSGLHQGINTLYNLILSSKQS